ncbi:hypothetical protein [Streptomyces sp. NPDC020983]
MAPLLAGVPAAVFGLLAGAPALAAPHRPVVNGRAVTEVTR